MQAIRRDLQLPYFSGLSCSPARRPPLFPSSSSTLTGPHHGGGGARAKRRQGVKGEHLPCASLLRNEWRPWTPQRKLSRLGLRTHEVRADRCHSTSHDPAHHSHDGEPRQKLCAPTLRPVEAHAGFVNMAHLAPALRDGAEFAGGAERRG